MKHHSKRILLLAAKIGFGSTLAIMIASFFELANPTSAATITLLTLVTTKWGTLKLSIRRLTTFTLTILLCFTFYNIIPNTWIAFAIIIFILVAYTEEMDCGNTLSVNALITIHYLNHQDFTLEFLLNELYLILIGTSIAFILNLFHYYSADEEQLIKYIHYTEDKMQDLLRQVVNYIDNMEVNTTVWGELKALDKEINKFYKRASEYQDNTFSSNPGYYMSYFEMREFQCKIIHDLHYEIRKIRNMPDQADIIADYITYLIPFVSHRNEPKAQLDKLDSLFEHMKNEKLPTSREEFESRAILYHVLMELEKFLLAKQHFIESLNEVQLKQYFKSENS